jgi:hypothetical protein
VQLDVDNLPPALAALRRKYSKPAIPAKNWEWVNALKNAALPRPRREQQDPGIRRGFELELHQLARVCHVAAALIRSQESDIDIPRPQYANYTVNQMSTNFIFGYYEETHASSKKDDRRMLPASVGWFKDDIVEYLQEKDVHRRQNGWRPAYAVRHLLYGPQPPQKSRSSRAAAGGSPGSVASSSSPGFMAQQNNDSELKQVFELLAKTTHAGERAQLLLVAEALAKSTQ